MKSARDFARFKAEGRKISMVTAYDAWSARLIARSQVDAILVGDSLAMVMHGHATTIPATVHLMAPPYARGGDVYRRQIPDRRSPLPVVSERHPGGNGGCRGPHLGRSPGREGGRT